MATIVKKGDGWQAQVFKLGIRKAATFPTKSKANAWAQQTELDIINGKSNIVTDKTLRNAIDRYADEVSPLKRGCRWELIRLETFRRLPFIDYKITDVTTPRLAEWRDDRLKQVQSSSVNREMNLLSAVFEQCRREWQWIDKNPVRDVRRPVQPAHRTRIFSEEEVLKIRESLNYRELITPTSKIEIIAQAFMFAIETGLRRGEIVSMQWSNVYLEAKYCVLPKTKNGDQREVPLSNMAVKILSLNKAFDKPFPVGEDVISTLFRRACKSAGVESATFHDARATALTRLSEKLDVLELAKMIGHRDPRSLMVYYRKSASQIADKLG